MPTHGLTDVLLLQAIESQDLASGAYRPGISLSDKRINKVSCAQQSFFSVVDLHAPYLDSRLASPGSHHLHHPLSTAAHACDLYEPSLAKIV